MENVEDMECTSGRLDTPEVTGELFLPVVVLRKVLKNLSNADLLNLSLVSKGWNYETRSVLRERNSLTAKMNKGELFCRCKDLRDFASVLRRMKEVRKVVPFSGLTIALSGDSDQHGDWCEGLSTEELDEVCEDILHRMEWKHLALHLNPRWNLEENCSGFHLVKNILHNFSCEIEEFSFNNITDHEAFTRHFLPECNFSLLKILKFLGRCPCREDQDLIRVLVSRAPNLEVLCTKERVNLTPNLLGGSAAVHMTDHPYVLSLDRDDEIPESIFGRLRLRHIQLAPFRQDFNFERFNRMVPVLLQQSCTALRSMELDAVLLVALMHYGICLENVREVDVGYYTLDTWHPRSRRLLKTFDFSGIFPNLRSARVICYMHTIPNFERTWNAVVDMVELRNAALIEHVNRSENIKQLNLNWCPGIRDASVRFLVKMFPHVEKIVIDSRRAPFVRFWDYWLDLEELDITLQDIPDFVENLDSTICGIFPEEVAELREHDEELRIVNIVPVMPSLSNLKRLKTFKLFFDGYGVSSSVDPLSELSKVTGLIAFKRLPDLTVTLATNSERFTRELEHMEPYASVRLAPRRIGD